MKTIAHLSDLHFGRVDASVFGKLASAIEAAKPDLVVVSGDMTQRARREEFIEAAAFLKTLPSPQLVIPGNHDVPLYDVFKRAFMPLTRYRRYITADLAPFYVDGEIAAAGLNTARALTFKDGRINREQLEAMARRFADLKGDITRIVVTHHPFEGASADDDEGIVGRAGMAMKAFAADRIDLVLSGHLHVNRIGPSAVRYKIEGYSALLLQAGTAISTRRREEANSFNLIHIDRPDIEVECWSWDMTSGRFSLLSERKFRLGAMGWAQVAGGDVPTIVAKGEGGASKVSF